jgi:hypothetical protein
MGETFLVEIVKNPLNHTAKIIMHMNKKVTNLFVGASRETEGALFAASGRMRPGEYLSLQKIRQLSGPRVPSPGRG